MDLESYLAFLNSGQMVVGGSEVHQFMHGVSRRPSALPRRSTAATMSRRN